MKGKAYLRTYVTGKRPRLDPDEIKRMIEEGYMRISRAHGIVARIDREDWKAEMKRRFGLSAGPDWYRRCMTSDKRDLHHDDALQFPTSDNHTGFRPKKGENDEICNE